MKKNVISLTGLAETLMVACHRGCQYSWQSGNVRHPKVIVWGDKQFNFNVVRGKAINLKH